MITSWRTEARLFTCSDDTSGGRARQAAGREEARVQIDPARLVMPLRPPFVAECGQTEVIVHIEHPDPILRHADLSHPLSRDRFQRLPVTGGEVSGVFLDVGGDVLAER